LKHVYTLHLVVFIAYMLSFLLQTVLFIYSALQLQVCLINSVQFSSVQYVSSSYHKRARILVYKNYMINLPNFLRWLSNSQASCGFSA